MPMRRGIKMFFLKERKRYPGHLDLFRSPYSMRAF